MHVSTCFIVLVFVVLLFVVLILALFNLTLVLILPLFSHLHSSYHYVIYVLIF